jgi:hypothetical protein
MQSCKKTKYSLLLKYFSFHMRIYSPEPVHHTLSNNTFSIPIASPDITRIISYIQMKIISSKKYLALKCLIIIDSDKLIYTLAYQAYKD